MIRIYGRTNCKESRKAEGLLTYLGIPYAFLNIKNRQDTVAKWLDSVDYLQILPQIFSKDEFLGTYQDLVQYLVSLDYVFDTNRNYLP